VPIPQFFPEHRPPLHINISSGKESAGAGFLNFLFKNGPALSHPKFLTWPTIFYMDVIQDYRFATKPQRCLDQFCLSSLAVD